MNHRHALRLALLATPGLPALVFAHPGHGPGAGVAHSIDATDPLLGLVAMGVVVGVGAVIVAAPRVAKRLATARAARPRR